MAAAPQNIQQVENDITSLILQVGEDMLQPVASGTISATTNANSNTVNVPMRQVGLTRGFLVKISATFTNAGTAAMNLTNFGPSNLISNFTVTDLDNYQRVNTTGWHMNMVNTAKEGWPFGAALLATATDSPVKYGNNYAAMSAPGSIAASGTGTIAMYYWVPLAYGKRDLRGALYTGVVNATAFLAFTLNPAPCVLSSADSTLACFSQASGTVGSITACSYTVYQNYIDQLPRYSGGKNAGAPILPPISQSTQYRLVNTALSAIQANQDFPVPFTNFQSFLSASVIFDNGGTLNAGTDVNQWKLLAANTLQFFYLDPVTQALRSRVKIMTDWPSGGYQFDFRDAPINTNQAGNMQLILNASTVNSNAQLLVGWESFAQVNSVLGAQSLPAS